MQAADIAEFEFVHIWNVTRGTRWRPRAPRRAGLACLLHQRRRGYLMKKGDRVIIATFTDVDKAQVGDWKPTVDRGREQQHR